MKLFIKPRKLVDFQRWAVTIFMIVATICYFVASQMVSFWIDYSLYCTSSIIFVFYSKKVIGPAYQEEFAQIQDSLLDLMPTEHKEEV